MNEAAHTISLISPSKSWKSSSSLIRATVIQHPSFYSAVNEPETRFASGMERDLSDLSRSKFSNLSPEILVEWIAPQVQVLEAST